MLILLIKDYSPFNKYNLYNVLVRVVILIVGVLKHK